MMSDFELDKELLLYLVEARPMLVGQNGRYL
jgi:hypothetical protein